MARIKQESVVFDPKKDFELFRAFDKGNKKDKGPKVKGDDAPKIEDIKGYKDLKGLTRYVNYYYPNLTVQGRYQKQRVWIYCNIHKTRWKCSFQQIISGIRDCVRCTGYNLRYTLKLTTNLKEWNKYLKVVHPTFKGLEYINETTPVMHLCKLCGNKWKVKPNLAETFSYSCRKCDNKGFSFTKEEAIKVRAFIKNRVNKLKELRKERQKTLSKEKEEKRAVQRKIKAYFDLEDKKAEESLKGKTLKQREIEDKNAKREALLKERKANNKLKIEKEKKVKLRKKALEKIKILNLEKRKRIRELKLKKIKEKHDLSKSRLKDQSVALVDAMVDLRHFKPSGKSTPKVIDMMPELELKPRVSKRSKAIGYPGTAHQKVFPDSSSSAGNLMLDDEYLI